MKKYYIQLTSKDYSESAVLAVCETESAAKALAILAAKNKIQAQAILGEALTNVIVQECDPEGDSEVIWDAQEDLGGL